MALYVTVTITANLAFCEVYIFSRNFNLIGKTLIMMALGKYSLKKVMDICDCFEISWLEQFSVEEYCACVTPHSGVLSLALSSAWALKALKREQRQLQSPLLRSSPGKENGLCIKNSYTSCLIVCLITGLSRVCHVYLFPLFPVTWLSLGNSYLVGSLGCLMSCWILLHLGCLKLSLNFIIFTHTQLLNPYRWQFSCWKCSYTLLRLCSWLSWKEINLVTELGKERAWKCSF